MAMHKKKYKILVGLSGGVDSAVSAFLLREQGHEVSAAFMKNFSENVNIKGTCPWKEDRLEAYRVASFLHIPIQTFDFEKIYQEKIVQYIFDSYRAGLTPNPDVLCNSEIKFKLFLKKALDLGFDYIATGHYARVKQDKSGCQLLKGRNKNKDQSYFLAGLDQSQLAHTIFPIGDLSKNKVRDIAHKIKLPNAARPDSQGICFIGKVDLQTFLSQKIKPKTGEIVDIDDHKLGEHQGVWYYTIGQRKGLNIGGSGPWYVVSKDLKNNKLIVGKADSDELFSRTVQITDLHWLSKKYKLPLKAKAKIRYRQADQNVIIKTPLLRGAGGLEAEFKTPQRGVASGQTLAVYKKDELVASAVII